MPAKRKTGPTPVETVTHKDKRVNIPTEETRRFMTEEKKGDSKLRYPRDPSLDPQLVWKGKDKQDGEDLTVPVVPIYIQEKVHPKAIIENLRQTAAAGESEPELTLFDDFNGITWEDQIDFYAHEQNWSNRMILGDSLMVMGSLAEKEGLKGKVQMIYIDPPYGIKFGSNWQVSTRKRDVKDNKAEDATRQPEQIKAFRDTWRLGIHSYLSYLRDRLTVARDLLTESGSIFVQIGDENVHRVRALLDEVFGDENSIGTIVFRKTGSLTDKQLPVVADYILWYAKQAANTKFRRLFGARSSLTDGLNAFRYVWRDGQVSTLAELGISADQLPEGDELCQSVTLTSQHPSMTRSEPWVFDGREYGPPSNRQWTVDEAGLNRLGWARRIFPAGENLRFASLLKDNPVTPVINIWQDTGVGSFTEENVYVVQTGRKVVERCILMSSDPGDLILDPTCGSGTTALVAEQLGRRWITVDTSRVALALARTRLMSARFPYYYLSDSPDGARKQAEIDQALEAKGPFQLDVKKGFVYKTVPHVTLKSIANNPDIKEGMSRDEIDAAIAKHADKEILYDQPYEDPKRIRVTGPFTVESLSPHRFVSTEPEDQPMAEVAAEDYDAGQFVTTILDNLKRAGVQNTIKQERLVFDRLEPFAGKFINATGEFIEKDGSERTVAVAIGPEHGTVSTDLIKEAAKEAIKGVGFDVLVVCGFAFDPAVSEDVKQYGSLVVLPTRMNPDLAMGEDLLKKTGAGNLFMVFGEPDITWSYEEGQLVVELHGLDVYDPTTGDIRSHSTDDIACWFIDTNYNNESFFVRHAYFTGADKPYEKLKRALKADIDEAAWASLYSTKSRPFDKSQTGSFAVKVINHYGDEVLKVYEV